VILFRLKLQPKLLHALPASILLPFAQTSVSRPIELLFNMPVIQLHDDNDSRLQTLPIFYKSCSKICRETEKVFQAFLNISNETVRLDSKGVQVLFRPLVCFHPNQMAESLITRLLYPLQRRVRREPVNLR
jgi:hypothetical protein